MKIGVLLKIVVKAVANMRGGEQMAKDKDLFLGGGMNKKTYEKKPLRERLWINL